jgi:hypothetical protein
MTEAINNITPSELRDFAKAFGWTLVPEAIQDQLFVLNHPENKKRQIIFPSDANAPGYLDSLSLVLEKLSDIQKMPVPFIISAIQELHDDSISFRISNARDEAASIPLNYAVTAINGAKELLLSGACTVLKPQLHHPRLSKNEAQELVSKARFRHTEKGSFSLKVSTPLKAMDIHPKLFSGDLPFVRQTTLAINQALVKIIQSIQTDSFETLIDTVKKEESPLISSNLCKAIISFQEENEKYDLSLAFKWAGALKVPGELQVQNVIKIQKDYFSKIEELKNELRKTEPKKEDTFVCSVEKLNGEMGTDGERQGEVILNLYQEGEVTKAKAYLTQEQYKKADQAHMTSSAYIKLKGILNPGNQPKVIDSISFFELILP